MRLSCFLLLLAAAVYAQDAPPAAAPTPTPAPAASPEPAPSETPKAPAESRPAELIGKVFRFNDLQATVVELHQLALVENKYSRRFRFDSYDNPKLAKLRKQEKLDELVAGASNEFEAQLRLLDWTYKRFPRFGAPTSKAFGALDILRDIDAGGTFNCMYYARVFVSVAASMGYVARPLALKRVDDAPGSTEHTVTEIWSNQYGKWVLFDPTYAMVAECEGVPLSAWELRQKWFHEKGKGVSFVFGRERRKCTVADLPVLRAHHEGFGDLALSSQTLNKLAMIAYIPNTDLMDKDYDYGGMFISRDALCEGASWHVRDNPDKPASEPYFPLDQAELKLAPAEGGINVEIATNTPNFEHYAYRIDEGEWKTGRPEHWSPPLGRHTLEVVAVNRFGVRGTPSRLVLEVEPAK